MRILVVDNEPGILSFLKKLLRQERYLVDTTRLAKTALKKIHSNPYDLIILDILPPDKKGVSFCEKLRTGKIDTPILILSYLDATTDKIKGLNKGADDYLSKPFHPEELLARINSLLRRRRIFINTILQTGNLSLNTKTYEVKKDGKIIYIPGKQFALLQYLLTKKGKIVSKGELITHLWGNRPAKSNALEVLVRRLRRSINRNYKEKLIETIYDAGYRLRSI
ncbi:MAG: response regulator transcription factor [Patescibacteria group bacterium]